MRRILNYQWNCCDYIFELLKGIQRPVNHIRSICVSVQCGFVFVSIWIRKWNSCWWNVYVFRIPFGSCVCMCVGNFHKKKFRNRYQYYLVSSISYLILDIYYFFLDSLIKLLFGDKQCVDNAWIFIGVSTSFNANDKNRWKIFDFIIFSSNPLTIRMEYFLFIISEIPFKVRQIIGFEQKKQKKKKEWQRNKYKCNRSGIFKIIVELAVTWIFDAKK